MWHYISRYKLDNHGKDIPISEHTIKISFNNLIKQLFLENPSIVANCIDLVFSGLKSDKTNRLHGIKTFLSAAPVCDFDYMLWYSLIESINIITRHEYQSDFKDGTGITMYKPS